MILLTIFAFDWPMFRGNGQLTGYTNESVPVPTELLWSAKVTEGCESSAAIVAGTVYVGDLNGDLSAFRLSDGALVWNFESGAEIKSSPTVTDGLVVFGNEDGFLHAVNVDTGTLAWKYESEGGIVSSVNAMDGRLIFGSYDNRCYAVSKEGHALWQLETDGYVHATPALFGELAVFGGCDGLVHVVATQNGASEFSQPVGGYVAASTCISGSIAVIPHFENGVLALDLNTRKTLWSIDDGQFPFYASSATNGEQVIIAGRDKQVRALNLIDGKPLWTYDARAKVDASPVIAGDVVWIATTRGEIVALQLGNGSLVWSFQGGDGFVASPAVSEQRLVIGTHSGDILCFGAKP
ncbi:MAG: PQQ-binding-like beta-propeller repeat protein [Acidobacteria bacterium]|nr:PQQ-binding-like beta-propeller repeat protein [Acidobacteriota bacterium]